MIVEAQCPYCKHIYKAATVKAAKRIRRDGCISCVIERMAERARQRAQTSQPPPASP